MLSEVWLLRNDRERRWRAGAAARLVSWLAPAPRLSVEQLRRQQGEVQRGHGRCSVRCCVLKGEMAMIKVNNLSEAGNQGDEEVVERTNLGQTGVILRITVELGHFSL